MAPQVVYPDATEMACDCVRDALTDIHVGSVIPDPRPDEFVVIRRVGGLREFPVVDNPTLTVEAYSQTEQDAHDLLQLARAALFAAEGETHAGHQVYLVTDVGGPAALPDPETDQPRYTSTVALKTRGGPPA